MAPGFGGLVVAEDRRLQESDQEILQAVVSFPTFQHDLINRLQIKHVRNSSRAVKGQFFQKPPHEILLIMTRKLLLEFEVAGKGLTSREASAGIHGPGRAFAPPGNFSVESAPLVAFEFHLAPAPAEVKVLKGKAQSDLVLGRLASPGSGMVGFPEKSVSWGAFRTMLAACD